MLHFFAHIFHFAWGHSVPSTSDLFQFFCMEFAKKQYYRPCDFIYVIVGLLGSLFLCREHLTRCGAINSMDGAGTSGDAVRRCCYDTPCAAAGSQNDTSETEGWHFCVFAAFIKHCMLPIPNWHILKSSESPFLKKPTCNTLLCRVFHL